MTTAGIALILCMVLIGLDLPLLAVACFFFSVGIFTLGTYANSPYQNNLVLGILISAFVLSGLFGLLSLVSYGGWLLKLLGLR